MQVRCAVYNGTLADIGLALPDAKALLATLPRCRNLSSALLSYGRETSERKRSRCPGAVVRLRPVPVAELRPKVYRGLGSLKELPGWEMDGTT